MHSESSIQKETISHGGQTEKDTGKKTKYTDLTTSQSQTREKFCPNCNFKNEHEDNFVKSVVPLWICQNILNQRSQIKLSPIKSSHFFGNKRIDEINKEIEEFINLSYDLRDYYDDLTKLTSLKLNKTEFKEKYSKISIDDFKYLDEINEDEVLNKKILSLKSIKTFITNFDDEIEKLNKLIKDIDLFNDDLNELLNSDEKLDVSDKNTLIQVHKNTYDFFDRDKVKNLNIDSKNITSII